MKVFAFKCGIEHVTRSFLDPFDADPGLGVDIPYFFFLVEHPSGYLLFDTGVNPAVRTDAEARLGPGASAIDMHLREDDAITNQLASIGVAPSDIAHVAHSHLHFDHAGGIEFFPGAKFYVQRPELPFAWWPPIYYRSAYARADFDHDVRWKELDGEHDVFRDGRVILFPTPGHTPGHQSLLVALEGKSVILLGDAAFDPRKMRERALPGQMWSPDALLRSWERIEEFQERYDAELIVTHNVLYEQETRVAPHAWYE